MRESRLFWFHVEEKSNLWQGIKVSSIFNRLEHFSRLINRIALARGRVTYETPLESYALYLHTTIRTGGSRVVGVGLNPELYSATVHSQINFKAPQKTTLMADPHDATIRDARDALEQTQKHKDYGYFTQKYTNPKARIGILFELSHLCGNARRDVQISFANIQEAFASCPLNLSLGLGARRQLETWIESEQKAQAPLLVGRFVGFHSTRNEFWLRLEDAGIEVKCIYEGENFRDLLGDEVLIDGDIVEVVGNFVEFAPKPPMIQDVKRVVKLRDARDEKWDFQVFDPEEETKEILEDRDIMESLQRSQEDIANNRMLSFEDLQKQVEDRERKEKASRRRQKKLRV